MIAPGAWRSFQRLPWAVATGKGAVGRAVRRRSVTVRMAASRSLDSA